METLAGQAFALTAALCAGVILGFIYDWYRVIKEIWGFKGAAVALGDAVFWLVCTAVAFVWFLIWVRGEVRFFLFAGMGLGAAVYCFTLSRPARHAVRLAMFLFLKTWYLIKSICFWTFKIISLPWRLFLEGAGRLFSVFSRAVKAAAGKIYGKIYKKIFKPKK